MRRTAQAADQVPGPEQGVKVLISVLWSNIVGAKIFLGSFFFFNKKSRVFCARFFIVQASL
jgi:hypothetical protein